MTVSKHSGAPDTSIFNTHWDKLNWRRIEKNVYRLQMRIAKAVINKQYGKVKSLQWLLVHSVDAKLLAVKRVTTTEGRKTAGVDGVKWTTSKEKYQAALGLKLEDIRLNPYEEYIFQRKMEKSDL